MFATLLLIETQLQKVVLVGLLLTSANVTASPPYPEAPTPQTTTVKVKIYFDKGSYKVSKSSEALLNTFAANMKSNPRFSLVEVAGHASKDESKMRYSISRRRAQAVRKALIERGVKKKRLVAKGYGHSHPVTKSPQSAALNRRVEFVVRKVKKQK